MKKIYPKLFLGYQDKAQYLWGYLKDNPEKTKEEAYSDLKLQYDAAYCPACSEAGRYGGEWDCSRCPLYGKWPASYSSVVDKCDDKGSVYLKWVASTDNHERAAHAEKIVQAIINDWEV